MMVREMISRIVRMMTKIPSILSYSRMYNMILDWMKTVYNTVAWGVKLDTLRYLLMRHYQEMKDWNHGEMVLLVFYAFDT